MRTKTKTRSHEIILKDGEPKAVIIDIREYQEMLECLENIEDLKVLQRIRQKPLRFRKFEEFIKEYKQSV